MNRVWLMVLFIGCTGQEAPDPNCVTDAQFFETQAAPLLEARCYGCHNADGIASDRRYLLKPSDSDKNRSDNYAMLQDFFAETADEPTLFLDKPTGRHSHGGGTVSYTHLTLPTICSV